eukprot:scaffold948_cov106-Cylindrotheca_fusiformis.AAC.15
MWLIKFSLLIALANASVDTGNSLRGRFYADGEEAEWFYRITQNTGSMGPTPPPVAPPTPTVVPAVKSNSGFSASHFKTWNGGFSFQGAGDFVYLDSSLAKIHIRTTLGQGGTYSYISQLVLSLGGDILEIHNDRTYFVNGNTPLNPPQSVGGYPFSAIGGRFSIDLGQGQSIRVDSTFGGFITVAVTGNADDFGDSRGLTGSFDVDKAILRDGSLVDANPGEIVTEWLVDTDKGDELLFLQAPPQDGVLVATPVTFTPEDRAAAEEACSRLQNDQALFNNCVFDVLATGDLDMALNEALGPLPDEPFCASENKCLEGTIDSNGVCQYISIPCSNSTFICNPVDGICKSPDDLIPCVAVIDESSQSDSYLTQLWAEFRSKYPDRPFTVLQPPSTGTLYLPPDFVDDPLTRYFPVVRDAELGLPPSDWFELSGLPQYSNVKYVGLFIDDSGSMREWQVQGSIDLFLNKTAAVGLEVRKVTDPNEDYILPFLTTLV